MFASHGLERVTSSDRDDDSGTRVAKIKKTDSNGDGSIDASDTATRTDDHRNPTGYAQVLEELNGATGELLKSYTIGHDVFLEVS